MRSLIIYLANCIFNLGTKSGMPKYTAFLGLFQAGVLFIPESILAMLGVNGQEIMGWYPSFIQHYIIGSSFKNAMSAFWLISPFICIICTVLYTLHINTFGYKSYLDRRAARLEKARKTKDYSLITGILAMILLYVWGTAIYQTEPKIYGSFIPAKNKFAMLIIHAGALGLLFPAALALLITEIRANFSVPKSSKK